MLNIALPKGRLGEKVYSVFEAAGFECPYIHENSRKLIFENAEKGVRYFWVKLISGSRARTFCLSTAPTYTSCLT